MRAARHVRHVLCLSSVHRNPLHHCHDLYSIPDYSPNCCILPFCLQLRHTSGEVCWRQHVFPHVISLILSSVSVFFFFGKPTSVFCLLRNAIFAFFFTVCFFSVWLSVPFKLFVFFKMAAQFPKVYSLWVKHNGQWVFVAFSFFHSFNFLCDMDDCQSCQAHCWLMDF